MTEFAIRPSDLLTPYCTPGNPPLKKGETVIFPDGKYGTVTRAYAFDNKYAVKVMGSAGELRGPDGGFVYYRKEDLQRPAPLPQAQDAMEPASKQARLSDGANVASPDALGANGEAIPRRLAGIVKWFRKDQGYGKIEPVAMNGRLGGEEVFVHRKQMDGGPEGPHAQAIDVGIAVTYEVTMGIDGKPCAANVQVRGIAPTLAPLDPTKRDPAQDALLIRLLQTGMHVGTHQITGHHKTSSEDRFFARVGVPINLGESLKNTHCALFGVFDGHAGASCSEFVHVQLDKAIFDCIRHRGARNEGGREVPSDVTLKSSLQAAFRTTEHNFFQYVNKLEGGAASAWATAGSTACTCCFYGPDENGQLRLVVANAGDSRIVLGKKDGRAVRLSEDHTPDVPSERKRIEQNGAAVVQANGIWRIVLPSKRGTGLAGLSVSRGFGDLEYKQPAGVVSAVPDVFIRTIDPREDSFVILASDGVWGPVPDADAVRIVSQALREGGDRCVREAAKSLSETAHQLEPSDDKTAIVVFFGAVPDPPVAASNLPMRSAAVKMKPRHVASAKNATDDMFAGGTGQGKSPVAMDDLDDLFASYAREIGGR